MSKRYKIGELALEVDENDNQSYHVYCLSPQIDQGGISGINWGSNQTTTLEGALALLGLYIEGNFDEILKRVKKRNEDS